MDTFVEDRTAAFEKTFLTQRWDAAQEFLDDHGLRLPIECGEDKMAMIVFVVYLTHSKFQGKTKTSTDRAIQSETGTKALEWLKSMRYVVLPGFVLHNVPFDRKIPIPDCLKMEGFPDAHVPVPTPAGDSAKPSKT